MHLLALVWITIQHSTAESLCCTSETYITLYVIKTVRKKHLGGADDLHPDVSSPQEALFYMLHNQMAKPLATAHETVKNIAELICWGRSNEQEVQEQWGR